AHEDVSSQRVLTMSWEEGPSLQAWLRSNPSYAEREWVGRTILDLYCLEFFEWGFVQTDPNPANFLVRAPQRQMVLLDLGAAMHYDVEFRDNYVRLLSVLGTRDRDAIVQAGIEFDLLDEREGDEPRNLFAELLIAAMTPFEPQRQPFVFRDDKYSARARQIGQDFAQSLRFSPPPRKLIFLHRKLGGIFNLLKRLDLQLDLVPYWERMVGAEIHAA
ncbi:MAG: AarF/UbiB family protein, partial [Myxococcota bacterium]